MYLYTNVQLNGKLENRIIYVFFFLNGQITIYVYRPIKCDDEVCMEPDITEKPETCSEDIGDEILRFC